MTVTSVGLGEGPTTATVACSRNQCNLWRHAAETMLRRLRSAPNFEGIVYTHQAAEPARLGRADRHGEGNRTPHGTSRGTKVSGNTSSNSCAFAGRLPGSATGLLGRTSTLRRCLRVRQLPPWLRCQRSEPRTSSRQPSKTRSSAVFLSSATQGTPCTRTVSWHAPSQLSWTLPCRPEFSRPCFVSTHTRGCLSTTAAGGALSADARSTAPSASC